MKDTILHIRFNSVIKKQLEEQAERENTNFSNLVDRILRNYLQKERGNEMNKYNYEGTEIELTQDAYITTINGEVGTEYYTAGAVDAEGNDYIVNWKITEYWKDKLDECDDESNLCDWDNPAEIRKI